MVRDMGYDDLEQVSILENTCFSVPWSKTVIKESFDRNYEYFWVYESDGIIVAYLNLRVIGDEGELNRIAVLPEYRRLGIAKKLMDKMESFSHKKGVGALALEVRESNQPAIKLYKIYGFKEEGVRKDYYANPIEDGIMMWRR